MVFRFISVCDGGSRHQMRSQVDKGLVFTSIESLNKVQLNLRKCG